MTGSVHVLAKFAIVATLAATLGCLDSMEPASDSAPISVFPVRSEVFVGESLTSLDITVPLRVHNSGSRIVYVDEFYRRTEKLVDQRWELVFETGPAFGAARTLGPSQNVTLTYTMIFQRDGGIPLLKHPQGLYRVLLRMSYARDGSDLLPPDAWSSTPFVVIGQGD